MPPHILVDRSPSPFGTVVVYDQGSERYMAFENSASCLSCVNLRSPEALAFPYTQAMMSCLLFVPAPRRVLCVGLGAGSVPQALAAACPEALIDSVEINPTITALAKSHFGFLETARNRVHTADARDFIERAAAGGVRYDVILLDAFDAEYVPPHLATRGFFAAVAGALAPGGVMMANTFSCRPAAARELATYQAVWSEVRTLSTGTVNVVVVATDEWPSPALLRSRALSWAPALSRFGVHVEDCLLRYRRLSTPTACPFEDAREGIRCPPAVSQKGPAGSQEPLGVPAAAAPSETGRALRMTSA